MLFSAVQCDRISNFRYGYSYFPLLYVRTGNALAGLCTCTYSPGHSLFAYNNVIRTRIICKLMFIYYFLKEIIAPLSGRYSNVLHQISHNAKSAHACWCSKAVIVWLCACTGDNLLAKAHGLSSRTYAQAIQ